jgi:hypothetical protein
LAWTISPGTAFGTDYAPLAVVFFERGFPSESVLQTSM